MKQTQETLRIKDSIKEAILYIAFELSHLKWKLAFGNGEKMRTVTIEACIWINCTRRSRKPSNDLGLRGRYGWSAAMKRVAMDFGCIGIY